jgi:phenylalanine ammonia-lyase
LFLRQSKLLHRNREGLEAGELRQDRYSIRSASQWIGPVLEDLVLANKQVTIECNSITDNPIIDPSGQTLHSANFQAKSVSSAMDKTRYALEALGRILFSQCSELSNPATNKGLPPNLVADEPSNTWLMKPFDTMIAASQGELGFLSSPVTMCTRQRWGTSLYIVSPLSPLDILINHLAFFRSL